MTWFILDGENGRKIEKRPSLSHYDNLQPRPMRGAVEYPPQHGEFNQRFVSDSERTHAADKALLVALGVDGSVPLKRARVNAGLPRAANDNNEIAAKAA